ncbi:S8 family peptidase [Aneurinibacillus sp. Ricciae_BoGa-3]|uniref:S8 family peptidase n=1 Tax=Aneurinibacillus sp. Ricciae_BoGa-3 TaxID=3022697 RepID=UPI00234179BA|nr:S8 family peptidase [Aneurinibacillus sp. Ricciae_BoGa-3]WCK53579.1 S8 family peptidase [Aneurinibacillus sp. Ricciae_BoGa-3]
MTKRYLLQAKKSVKNTCDVCTQQGGIKILHTHKYLPLIIAEANDVEKFERNTEIVYYEEDFSIRLHEALPVSKDRKLANVPWNIREIQAPAAWPKTSGKGVRVGVLDTGIDSGHPALRGRVAGGYNVITDTGNFKDDNGHGTHVSGIIAASASRAHVYGVAPQASLYGIKVLDSSGSGSISHIVKGIEWAVDHHIQVLNMSLGSNQYSRSLDLATQFAAQKGIILVASAGNDGNNRGSGNTLDYPARLPSVISVGAVDQSKQRADFSSTGRGLDIMAPGVDIRSTWIGGGYKTLSGTSMSAAHVSGGAALLLGLYPNRKNGRNGRAIVRLSQKLGPSRLYGRGLLNLAPLSR